MEIRIKTIKPWKRRPRVGRLAPLPLATKPRTKAPHHGRPRTAPTP